MYRLIIAETILPMIARELLSWLCSCWSGSTQANIFVVAVGGNGVADVHSPLPQPFPRGGREFSADDQAFAISLSFGSWQLVLGLDGAPRQPPSRPPPEEGGFPVLLLDAELLGFVNGFDTLAEGPLHFL